jgi:CheY-like chemotaxis protein
MVILIVEDDKLIQKVLMNACNTCGISAIVTNNGQEALELLDTFTFDAIVSDIDMPLKNGIELYKEIENQYPSLAAMFFFHSGNFFRPGFTFPTSKMFIKGLTSAFSMFSQIKNMFNQQALSARVG